MSTSIGLQIRCWLEQPHNLPSELTHRVRTQAALLKSQQRGGHTLDTAELRPGGTEPAMSEESATAGATPPR